MIWLLGAGVYVVCEAVAAGRHPGYRYLSNYISDLGTSAVMNVGGFMVHGVLFLAGAVVLIRACPAPGAIGWAFMLAAAANAVGNILVGAFPSGPDGAVPLHIIGAGLAIIGGNVAVILAGVGGAQIGLSPAYSHTSVALGIFGIGCLLALTVFPVGVVERGAVYSIIAWEIITGVALLRGLSR